MGGAAWVAQAILVMVVFQVAGVFFTSFVLIWLVSLALVVVGLVIKSRIPNEPRHRRESIRVSRRSRIGIWLVASEPENTTPSREATR